jgi:hypothetical protein
LIRQMKMEKPSTDIGELKFRKDIFGLPEEHKQELISRHYFARKKRLRSKNGLSDN